MDTHQAPRHARLMDLRFVIATMFAIFGVLVTASGFTADNEEIEQAAGINISLWTGIGLLLLSGCFTLWLVRVPPDVPEGHPAADDLANGGGAG